AACLDRPLVVCRGGAARPCFFRRPDLAPGYCAGRVGGNDHWNPGLGVYAVVAQPGERRHRGSEPALARALGDSAAAPAGTDRTRTASARARRDLEPCAQRSRLRGVLAWTRSEFDRTIAS